MKCLLLPKAFVTTWGNPNAGALWLSQLWLVGAGVQDWSLCRGWHTPAWGLGSQSQNEGLLEKFLLQMTLKLFMQYPHAFCGYRYHYFIMLSCEV